MLVAILSTLAYLTLGLAIASRAAPAGEGEADPSRARSAWDTALRALIAGLGSWVAVSWLLAFAHLLVPWALALAATAAFVGGVALLRASRARAGKDASAPAQAPPWTLVFLAPLTLWVVYVFARSALVPVENHDAIAYHLPRAVLFLLDEGYRFHREINEPRLTAWPANYELLLANVLVLGKSDAGTVVFGVLAYLGLAGIGASLAERWWGRSLEASLSTFALVAATPVMILHAGAHKNDLLFGLFAAAAVYWAVPFAMRGARADGLGSMTALGLAIGTKVHGGLVGVACLPLLLLGLRKLQGARERASVVAFGALAAFGLGGSVLALNLVHTGSLGLSVTTFANAYGPFYGDYANLWRFPIVMLAAPFTSSEALWVYWSSSRYQWNEFDLYLSHYGAAFTLAVVAVPLLFWLERRRRADAPASLVDRAASLGALLLAFSVLLPVRARPYGWFFSEVRYYVAVVPFVLAWGVGGAWWAARTTQASAKARAAARGIAFASIGLWMSRTIVVFAAEDAYQPFVFVETVARSDKPAHEPPTQYYNKRAGYLLDQLAGPRDVVAVDLGYDTWVYPVFGADYHRPLRLLDTSPPGPVTVPADATWVLVDRGHLEIFYAQPELTDLALPNVKRYWRHGKARPNNYKLLEQLQHDPAFELVYYDPSANQAIFKRKPRSGS